MPGIDFTNSTADRLNESPSEKEGKFHHRNGSQPRRTCRLNESPSEKEGK